jgi:hypothetical protein
MNEKDTRKIAYLPFHAINQFMMDDYRRTVIRAAVNAQRTVDSGLSGNLDKQVRRHVTIPGFRNSVKAPPALKARHLEEPFEKHPEVVGAVVSVWAAARPELRDQVFQLLSSRAWQVMPADADRSRLPGFLTRWPSGEDFESLVEAFHEMYPELEVEDDDISLMVVWLSGRLPVDTEDEPAEE